MEDIFRKRITKLEKEQLKNTLLIVGLEKSMIDEPSTYATMHDDLDEYKAREMYLKAEIEAVYTLLEAAEG